MSKLWSKRSSIIKNLYKKYNSKKKDLQEYIYIDPDSDLVSDSGLVSDSEPETPFGSLIYKIIENPDTDIKNVIYGFINKHYILVGNSNTVNVYSNELLDCLLKNSVCVIFLPKDNEQLNDTIIGLAFFHKDYFYSKGNSEITNQIPYINVKLLCLSTDFYNIHILKFMIKCIGKIYTMKNNETIKYIIYKLRRPISLSYFCKKSYYCRPINIDHTITNQNSSFNFNNIIDSNLPLIKKLYNTFSYPTYFVNDFHLEFFLDLKDLSHDEKTSFVNTIFNLVNNYKSSSYTIYKSDTKQDIEEMLSNPNFYKFIIRDQNNVINNFICLYSCDIYYDTKCKNAIVYSIVLENLSLSYLSYILEYISEYCYNNNLCDMIILDNFVDITGYKIYKLSRFHLDCYYYCEQFDIKTKPCKNGLTAL
jgi:hypothetical protein